jgi:hypothetical protein
MVNDGDGWEKIVDSRLNRRCWMVVLATTKMCNYNNRPYNENLEETILLAGKALVR